jgi:probable phosphoglycerate mutase
VRVRVEADGGSRGNPGPAGYGAVVLSADGTDVLAERSEFLGITTNNVAEYRGLIAGLGAARELGAREVEVRMDSKLVIEQMSGRWQVKHPALRPLAREALALREAFEAVSFTWVPRAQNTRADRLANEAMDRGSAVGPESGATPRVAWAPPDGTPTKLVLVRHGSTAHTAEHRLSGRNDLPLVAAGEQQASDLAARIGGFGDVAAVLSSPLRRAQQTARPIAAAAAVEVRTLDELTEMDYGAWEGLTAAEAQERNPEKFAAWLGSPDVAPPGGESFADVARRVQRARDSIITAHPGQVVVAVTHVTPIKTLLRLALDAPSSSMFRLHLDPGMASVVDYFADGTVSIRRVNG